MLRDLKLALDITWEDNDTNEKLLGILKRAEHRINNYAGTKIEYLNDLTARQLVLDLAMYIYNNVSEEFEKNYSSEITALRNAYLVKAYCEENHEEESDI